MVTPSPIADLQPADANFGNFGNQLKSVESAAKQFTLRNVGGSPLTISSITVTGPQAAEFRKDDSNCTGAPTNNTLAPSASCTIRIFFKPSERGTRNATLTVNSNTNLVTKSLEGKASRLLLRSRRIRGRSATSSRAARPPRSSSRSRTPVTRR